MIAGVILAAGASRRMGARDKMLEDVDSKPMLAHIIDEAEASLLDHVYVVLPPRDIAAARHQLIGTRTPVIATDWAEGMAASMRAGIQAVDPNAQGVMMILADMPEVRSDLINQLIAQFHPDLIARAATVDGVAGHPVLFGKAYFARLKTLTGDIGAKEVLRDAADKVVHVRTRDQAATLDLDTPAAWDKWRAR